MEDSILQLKIELTGFKAINEDFKNEMRKIVKALYEKIDQLSKKKKNNEEEETETETESNDDGKPVKEIVVHKKMKMRLMMKLRFMMNLRQMMTSKKIRKEKK